MPPYGSFSIDYWGFYNGKANTNLIPKTVVRGRDMNAVRFNNGDFYANLFPKNQTWHIGGADRHSSAEHMQAGIIEKVTYPTGGFTRYEFEPHQFTTDRQIQEAITHGGRTRSIDVNTKSEDKYEFSPDKDVIATVSIDFSPPVPPSIRTCR